MIKALEIGCDIRGTGRLPGPVGAYKRNLMVFGLSLARLRTAFRDAAARRSFARRVRDNRRIIRISFPNRVGHLCLEIDALLKDTVLAGGDTRRFVLPDLRNGFANQHVVRYFSRYVTVDPDPALARYIGDPAHKDAAIVDTHPYAVAMYQSAKCYDVYTRWGDRPPLFEISDQDSAALDRFRAAVGMPKDAWFVCLHAREGGYSPIDEHIHKFRSVSIESYTTAVRTITERGGWVVRLGDATMRPYAPGPQVVDYALSPHKSAQLDVALGAQCRFLLGSSSGPTLLATIFGRPCVVAHAAPIGAALGNTPKDISIPQHLRDGTGRLLTLPEMIADESSHFRLLEEFNGRDLVNIPNSPDEIDEATREMLERLDGTIIYTDEDRQRQTAFRSALRADHYTVESAASLGRDYLRRHMPLPASVSGR